MKMDSLSNQRWRLLCGAMVLVFGWLLLALLPGCGGSPCSGTCLKINVKMDKALDTSKAHELTIFLTPEQKPFNEINQTWTFSVGNGLTATRRKTEDGRATSELLFAHPDWPQYFGLSALTKGTEDPATEVKIISLNISVFLGTTWLSKLKEANGLQVWFNAEGFKMPTPFYARATIKNSEANCIAYQSQGYIQLGFDGAKSFDASSWEPDACGSK